MIKHFYRAKKQRQFLGFTLIELLVAALMGAIFLAASAGIIVRTLSIDREETGRANVQAELTQVMDYIQRDISEAIYIYNDGNAPATTDGQLGNGIPDLTEILYDPGWIKQPPGSIPVVAFWKLAPIPNDCYNPDSFDPALFPNGPVLRDPAPLGITPPQWENIRRRRNVYNLVVYYLRRNFNNNGNLADGSLTPWEGNARITRYVLNPFGRQNPGTGHRCEVRNAFFNEDPDPFFAGFLAWPRLEALQLPAQGNDISNPTTLATNIFSSRLGAPQRALPTIPTAALQPDATCSQYDPNPGSPPYVYALAGGRAVPPPPRTATFSPLLANEGDLSFYVCVRKTTGADLPQDVIIHLTGTSLQRANIGLFNRYIDNANNITEQQLAPYLHTIETRVLSRGAIGRPA